jgi:hypothetical protein
MDLTIWGFSRSLAPGGPRRSAGNLSLRASTEAAEDGRGMGQAWVNS